MTQPGASGLTVRAKRINAAYRLNKMRARQSPRVGTRGLHKQGSTPSWMLRSSQRPDGHVKKGARPVLAWLAGRSGLIRRIERVFGSTMMQARRAPDGEPCQPYQQEATPSWSPKRPQRLAGQTKPLQAGSRAGAFHATGGLTCQRPAGAFCTSFGAGSIRKKITALLAARCYFSISGAVFV